MHPRLERNEKMVPRVELIKNVSPTQDMNAENSIIFFGGSAILLQK